MEVGGVRKPDSPSLRRSNRPGSSPSQGFVAEEVHEARASALTSAAPLAAIDTILALQSVSDSLDERQRGILHGDDMLALLDQVRDGLLAGGISRSVLGRLANVASRRHEVFADPKLTAILDEIELRAHVELAKLEQAAKPRI